MRHALGRSRRTDWPAVGPGSGPGPETRSGTRSGTRSETRSGTGAGDPARNRGQEQVTASGPGVEGPLAVKPMVTDCPAGRFLAQSGPFAVQVVPLVVTTAFQALASVTPAGIDQVAAQLPSAEPPVFLTVSSPWKPPCQEFTSL